MRTRRTEPTWREFERVVAMIEEAAAPRGATVKSPDRIRDLTTGGIREVDASIRFRLGTVNILITVECQRRSRKASDTWIEQLATKRQKLGASKTIAVSEKGFSRAAHLTAKHHGIELRTLSEIAPRDIEGWFLTGTVVNCIPETSNFGCSIKIEGCPDYIELADPWEPRLFHDHVASPFPAVNLWVFHEMRHARRFWGLPRDGSVVRTTFDMDATKPDLIPIPIPVTRNTPSHLTIDLGGSRKVITDVRVSADVSIHTVLFDSTEAVHRAYQGTDGPVAQHARFKGEALGMPVTFDLASRGVDDVTGIVEFPSGARLGLAWVESSRPSILARAACAFCDRPSEMTPQPILPDFLVPPGVKARERFLCTNCSRRFEEWDAYAAEVWRHLPEDLTGTLHGAFSLRNIDGAVVRLWLLSLVWRMGMSQALTAVDLREHAALVRAVLDGKTKDQRGCYPASCVALSSEGRRVEFFFPPHWGQGGGARVLSVVLQGVLFNFMLGTDTSDSAQLVSDDEWVFPILDWREVDFLADAALKARAAREAARK